MIDNLTSTLGYQVGTNLHGAGYDWRLGPLGHQQTSQPGGYFDKLKSLVERTTETNAKKAVIVTHSLGGPTALSFMQVMGPEWVRKHVAAFVPLSAPWIGGAAMALTEIGGDNLDEPIPHDYLMPVQRESESGVFIMPYNTTEGWGSDPMVTTPTKTYNVDELPEMMQDLGLSQTLALWNALNRTRQLAGQLAPPVISTYVMYSVGVKTRRSFEYDRSFSSGSDLAPSKIIYGDGDGTVNVESLTWAERTWKSSGGMTANLTTYTIDGVAHIGSVSDPGVLSRLLGILTRVASSAA